MLRNIVRVTSLGALNYITKLKIPPRYVRVRRTRIRNGILSAAGLYGVICAKDYTENYTSQDDIKKATEEGEKYLAQLMRMLRMLILQTSIEYQENLIKQIEITRESTQIGPVGEHWDRLVSFRVKGNELKDELTKYEALAENIADIIHQDAMLLFVGNEIVLEKLQTELRKLQKLCKEQLEEIHRHEAELLRANRDSILYGGN